MAANIFVPAHQVRHTDEMGRQLDFTQTPDGDVSVRVRYGLAKINKVYQNNIFIQPNSVGLPLSNINLKDMTPVQRKAVIVAIENDTADVRSENGRITDIKKRNTIGDVYFHEISSITIVLR